MEAQLDYSVCRMVSNEQWVPVHPAHGPQGVIPLARRTALLAAIGGTQVSEHWHLLICDMLQPVPASTCHGFLWHLQWQT